MRDEDLTASIIKHFPTHPSTNHISHTPKFPDLSSNK
jgi:hypothetical protein